MSLIGPSEKWRDIGGFFADLAHLVVGDPQLSRRRCTGTCPKGLNPARAKSFYTSATKPLAT